jgi:mRNA interferase MazF
LFRRMPLKRLLGRELSPKATRAACRSQRREGSLVLDQLRTVDGSRLLRLLGRLSAPTLDATLPRTLQETFAPYVGP